MSSPSSPLLSSTSSASPPGRGEEEEEEDKEEQAVEEGEDKEEGTWATAVARMKRIWCSSWLSHFLILRKTGNVLD